MDAEPRLLRPFVLIATAFVVMGSVAGFMVWLLAREQSEATGEGPPAGSLREVTLHPVPYPDSVPEMERRRLTGLLDAALAAPEPTTVTAEEQEAVASGLAIVPPALDRLYALSVSPGFADPAARKKVRVIDRLLRSVQMRVAPTSPVARPARDAPDVVIDLRARAWFRWWEERSSESVSPMGAGDPK